MHRSVRMGSAAHLLSLAGRSAASERLFEAASGLCQAWVGDDATLECDRRVELRRVRVAAAHGHCAAGGSDEQRG